MKLSPRQRRGLLIALLAGLSIGLLAFAAYLLALDREVRTRFAGARWALPAQVYAAPTLLYPGVSLSRKAIQRELERLGYRLVSKTAGPGSYSTRRGIVEIHTRPFQFWDGLQPATRVQVSFDEDSVVGLLDHETK